MTEPWEDRTILPERAKLILEMGRPTYEFLIEPDGRGTPRRRAIRCRVCGMESYHPKDIRHRYCGNCRAFHDEWERWHQLEVAERTPLTKQRWAAYERSLSDDRSAMEGPGRLLAGRGGDRQGEDGEGDP